MITITAPKKGLGQTVTAINLAIKIGNLLEDKVILVDSNQYSCGVVDYLSNSSWTRGLDEFKINLESGIGQTQGATEKWCKVVTNRLNIMASNQYLPFGNKDIEKLKEFTKQSYSVTLVDSIAGENSLTNTFLQQSDVVLVVLSQDNNIIRLIRDKGLYQDYQEKVIFVINQYRDSVDGIKIKYGFKEIKEELKGLGFIENPIFTLPYDGGLINECNDHTLLNYSLAKENQYNQYLHQLDKLVRRILKDYGDFQLITDAEVVKEKKSIFNFFTL